MIKPSDITKHLKKYIGLFTAEFTQYISVTSATVGATNLITVTAEDHGLTTGRKVVLTGGSARNILTAVEDGGDGLVIFTTAADHDLIMPRLPLDDKTVTLVGLGVYDIASVPDRHRFGVRMDTVPTLSGEYLRQHIWQGLQTITVVDEDTFTFTPDGMPPLPAGIVDSLTFVIGFRVAAAADFERAVAAYSTQTEPYLVVVMGDADTCKDRHTLNDSVAGFTRQDAGQLKIRQSFTTVVFIPTPNDLSGVNAQDKAYDSLLSAQMQCLLGYAGEDNNIIQYLTVPTSHGSAGKYNTAYYVHSYSWEFTQVVDYQDGFTHWTDVAFRDIFSSMSDMELNINLDQEV